MKTRSDLIRKSAKGEECTVRIDGVCNRNPETTVFAHAPYHGRFGMRDKDYWGAYACSDCHDYLDGRSTRVMNLCGNLWMDAIRQTLDKLIEKGIISIKGAK